MSFQSPQPPPPPEHPQPGQSQYDPYRQFTPDPWGSLRPAAFGVRAGAQIIDTVVRTVLSGVVGIFIGIIAVFTNPERFSHPTTESAGVSIAGWVVGFLGGTLYHAVSESVGGASLGKLICGLRVTTPALGRASFKSTVIRNLAILVDGLFFGLVAHGAMKSSPWQQRYGDRWANTLVVYANGAPEAVRGKGESIAAGVLLGLAIDSVLNALVLYFGGF